MPPPHFLKYIKVSNLKSVSFYSFCFQLCASLILDQCVVELCVDFGFEVAPACSLLSYLWGFVETSTEDLYLHFPGAQGCKLNLGYS